MGTHRLIVVGGYDPSLAPEAWTAPEIGVDAIVREMEGRGEEVPRYAFGHPKIDQLNPGKWFAEKLEGRLDSEKVLVQKSGYFARSAAPNEQDLDLIKRSAVVAAQDADPAGDKPQATEAPAEPRGGSSSKEATSSARGNAQGARTRRPATSRCSSCPAG